jgi:putative ABC transport system permease protein
VLFRSTDDGTQTEEGAFSVELLEALLEGEGEAGEEAGGGDWHFLLLRLEPGVPPGRVILSLNRQLGAYGVRAVDWRVAAGASAILLLLVRGLFNAGVLLVSVAGIIAAVNILLIAVFKRTAEIGTLRALGAYDGYIRALILGENLTLALLAGTAGVLAGCFFLPLIGGMGARIPNALLRSLLGGSGAGASFSPLVAASSLGMALLLGLVSSMYPVEMAVRIEPAAALRQG